MSADDSKNHLKSWNLLPLALEIYPHPPTPCPAPCPPRSLYKGASTPVETGLVWFPTVEMMDWRLTYGKGRGLQVNKRRAALNMKERKKTCSTFWLEGKGDRNVVYAVCIKTQHWHAALKRVYVQEFHSGQVSSLNKCDLVICVLIAFPNQHITSRFYLWLQPECHL